MSPEQFTYWLQGFFELTSPQTIFPDQVKIIQDHLDLVFKKVTPKRNNSTYCEPSNGFKEAQQIVDEIMSLKIC